MSEVIKAPAKIRRTKTNKPQPPAYTALEDATDEEINAALSAQRSRSDFTRRVESLTEVGKSFKAVNGDVARIRQKLSVLAKRLGCKLIARPVENDVVIVRVEV